MVSGEKAPNMLELDKLYLVIWAKARREQGSLIESSHVDK